MHEILDNTTVVNPDTKEMYYKVLDALHKLGTKHDDHWDDYAENACLRLNLRGNHADRAHYQFEGNPFMDPEEFLRRVGNSQGLERPVVNTYPIY